MDITNENKILIIGGHNSGKTHYGGQLLGRLTCKEGEFKITSPPESYNLYKEVMDKLYNGLSAGHTPTSVHKELTLQLEDKDGRKVSLTVPDYAGEQIQQIVENRRINTKWEEQINSGNAWMLFIRLDEIQPIEDITNRGVPELAELKKREAGDPVFTIPKQTFYIELLQILLYSKGVSTMSPISSPKLTLVLTCWDKLEGIKEGTEPAEILKEKLPLLCAFINNIWEKSSFEIIGLSSTGKSLDASTPDIDYIEKGPEHFGYFIRSNGELEKDLTQTISPLIG